MTKRRKTIAEENSEEKSKARVDRGTSDDVELLRLVIDSHPGLRTRVINKIRELKVGLSTSALDEAQEKESRVREIRRNGGRPKQQ